MTAFDYGNARLRARKARFLVRADYRLLVGASDLDGLIGILGATRYGQDLEEVLPRYRSIRRIDAAVSYHIGRTLTEMAGFYEDEAGSAAALLLERWDLRNLQAVLRGVAGGVGPAEIASTLTPAGTIAQAVLRSLAAASSLRSLIDLMVALGVPGRRAALRVAETWPDYERSDDPAHLELAVHRVYTASWQARLAELDLPPLTLLFLREADRANLLAAIRLFALPADFADSKLDDHWVAGTLPAEVLSRAAGAADREAAAALLSAGMPAVWAQALDEWREHGDATRTSETVDAAITRELAAFFVTGDPLSVDIPVAFTAALESEARNVRWVARSVAAGRPPADALERLVMPW